MAWLLIISAAWCHGASQSLPTTRIGAKEYLPLSDWARSHGFTMRWVKRDEAIELTSPAVRLFLQIHSPEAQINGVAVRLLFPLVQKGEVVWISSLDTRTTFEPVLSPPRLRRGGLRSICLDPGHGGKDPGFQVGSNQNVRQPETLRRLRQIAKHAC